MVPESQKLTSCQECGETQLTPTKPEWTGSWHCWQCDALLSPGLGTSRTASMCFAITALLFLLSANLLPFMSLRYLGRTTAATIGQSVIALVEEGSWFIASVIFLASIVVPFLKVLLIICLGYWNEIGLSARLGAKVYRFADRIGRWSMLDVFVLAIVVTLLKFDELADAQVQAGAFAFLLAVIFTILASTFFDPKLLWRSQDD